MRCSPRALLGASPLPRRRVLRRPVLAGVVLALAGCRVVPPAPDLGGLYNRAAQRHDADTNPVIVIPGILGSRLVDGETGTIVWGAFGGGYANPSTPEGARLIALPMREGAALEELRDGVAPAGVLDRLDVRFLGLPVELQAYLNILRTLGAGGYRDQDIRPAGSVDYGDDHFTCFQFAYDWRRDNVENARLLHAFILEKKAQVEAELWRRYGVRKDVKFDLIAHSMGGLLTRYFLQYGSQELPADGTLPEATWEGARLVERAVLIGTPSAGSVEAPVQLVNGIRFSVWFPRYPAALLGTFPSIYQLFPRARHGALLEAPGGAPLDPYDPRLWASRGWGLAAAGEDALLADLLPDLPDAATRRRAAREHQHKCLERARRLAEALDRPLAPPPGLELHLVAGDAHPTARVAAATPEGGLEVVEHAPGDRTVLRSSALLDEREGGEWSPRLRSPIAWERVLFLFEDHIGLTRSTAFVDNLLYTLLEAPRRG